MIKPLPKWETFGEAHKAFDKAVCIGVQVRPLEIKWSIVAASISIVELRLKYYEFDSRFEFTLLQIDGISSCSYASLLLHLSLKAR